MTVLNILDVTKKLGRDIKEFKYYGTDIELTEQRTGFGYKKFFKCPICNQRRADLYIYRGRVYCRSCCPSSPYWGIQNTTRGGLLEFEYRQRRIADKNNIEYKAPFSYYNFLLKEPKINKEKWLRAIKQLQVLENMRFQTIFYQKKFKSDLIDYVLKNCLDFYNLADVEKYIIDWERVRKFDLKNQERIDYLKKRIALKEA